MQFNVFSEHVHDKEAVRTRALERVIRQFSESVAPGMVSISTRKIFKAGNESQHSTKTTCANRRFRIKNSGKQKEGAINIAPIAKKKVAEDPHRLLEDPQRSPQRRLAPGSWYGVSLSRAAKCRRPARFSDGAALDSRQLSGWRGGGKTKSRA